MSVPSTIAHRPLSGTPAVTPGDKPHVFVLLDGLRGVAALAVILFHMPQLFAPLAFPSGYLAVDFFFMLSGFVLSYAYGGKLDDGWSTWDYCKTRLARLYPLYFAGVVLGFLAWVMTRTFHHQPWFDLFQLASLVLGLVILPRMTLQGSTPAFPFNYPSWSIFFELIANIGQALFLRRRSTKTLCVISLAGLVGMAAYANALGSVNVGVSSPSNLFCVVRLTFSYTLGMLLFRAWRAGWARFKVPPIMLAAAFLFTLALPVSRHRVLQELLLVAIVFPLLVLLASGSQPGLRLQPVFAGLGRASYAIYILHAPIGFFYEEAQHRLRHFPSAPWHGLLFLVVLTVVSLVMDRVYDTPLRTYLRRRLVTRKAPRTA